MISFIEGTFKWRVDRDKSGVFRSSKAKFLGYTFVGEKSWAFARSFSNIRGTQNLTHLASRLRDNPEYSDTHVGGSASPKSPTVFAATWLGRRSEALLLGLGYHRASCRCLALSRHILGWYTALRYSTTLDSAKVTSQIRIEWLLCGPGSPTFSYFQHRNQCPNARELGCPRA